MATSLLARTETVAAFRRLNRRLLGCPEPVHVTQVLATLRILILLSDAAASE
jgi:hypothetical protein